MIVKDEPKIIKLNAVLIAQNADESEKLFQFVINTNIYMK